MQDIPSSSPSPASVRSHRFRVAKSLAGPVKLGQGIVFADQCPFDCVNSFDRQPPDEAATAINVLTFVRSRKIACQWTLKGATVKGPKRTSEVFSSNRRVTSTLGDKFLHSRLGPAMKKVKIVYWNPRRRRTHRGPLASPWGRVNNFGDLLGPILVDRLLAERGLKGASALKPARLLTVGSILQLARPGDVVWGTGVNGKWLDKDLSGSRLDIRAVRGPLTRSVLTTNGFFVPETYGDPALLIGRFWERQQLASGWPRTDVLVVPNLHDQGTYAGSSSVMSPTRPLWEVVGRIAASDFVAGSSLHAIVLAESLGIPARLIMPRVEPMFKYQDYYLGSGREMFAAAETIAEAVRLGGELPPKWDPKALLSAFPEDLWRSNPSDVPRIPRKTALGVSTGQDSVGQR